MNRFWQILALVMLALMVPASVCCYVVDDCSSQACQTCPCGEHDEGDRLPESCPSDSIAHSQVPAPVELPAMQMVELKNFIHEMKRLYELSAAKAAPVPLMTTAPPELRATWVFLSRAALPVRAPSELA